MTGALRDDGLLVPGVGHSTPLRPGDPRRLLQDALLRGDERVEPLGDGLLVRPALLRTWDEVLLQALGIRRLAEPMEIRPERLLVSAGYRWVVQVGGGPCARRGPWLVAPYAALLDADQEEVLRLAERVATAATRSRRLREVAAVQRIADRRPDLVLAPELRDRRVMVGETLRLSVVDGPGGLRTVPHLVDAADGAPIPLEAAELERVAVRGLTDEESHRIGDRWVLTTPGAARNLTMALAADAAPEEDRRRFVQNPTAFLPDDDAFDSADYAERVVGIGAADRSADARAAHDRDWVGDVSGLLVPDASGGQVLVPGARLPELRDALVRALAAGEPHARFDGRAIPATEALLRAVTRVLEGERPASSGAGRRAGERPIVLLIAENEVALDWAPSPGSARPVTSFEPRPARVDLQPHQRVALRTLQELWRAGERGALLCDDMGLGKTLQALAFGAWAAHQARVGRRSDRDTARGPIDVPLAIVAPPALLESWLRELERRFPSSELPTVLWGPADPPSWTPARTLVPLQKCVIDGRGQATVLQHARIDRKELADEDPDVLLVSYDQVRRLQFAIGQLRFAVLVADEAQSAKDPNSLRSRALRAMNVDFALALTGTPIENGWRDLWTLCDFAVPGRLGTLREFQDAYPQRGDVRELGTRLAETLAPVLIRRTRRDILDQLPPCALTRVEAPMPRDQALAYEAERIRYQEGGGAALVLLQRLSQVSLHPWQREDVGSAGAADAWAAASARTAVLWEALRRFRDEGAAVLVFVRSIAAQQTLQRAIRSSFGLDHVGILNGSESLPRRNALVNRVAAEEGFRVLLVSPEVGGVGWNLQFATRAVLLERTWNPAREAQMIARVHRLGQDRPVEVVIPIAVLEGGRSFDVILDELLADKRALAESVLAPAEITDDEVQARFRELMEAPAAAPPPPLRPVAHPGDAGVWAEALDLVSDEAVRALAEAVRGAGLPPPEPGFDVQHGKRVVTTLELAWPAARVAAVLPHQLDDQVRTLLLADGWRVFPVPADARELIDALTAPAEVRIGN